MWCAGVGLIWHVGLRRNLTSNCKSALSAPNLAKLGFRRLAIRPEHPKADAGAQTAFKKTFAA